jgi:DNA-binding response OmpR family regulator
VQLCAAEPATTDVAHPMLVSWQISHFMIKFPKKILLIDREPGVTRLVRRALDKAGKYLIREEHDDRLALHAARWFQPDLILLGAAGTDRQNLDRQIQADASLRETPVLSLNGLKPESQMVSGGILSGYSFFAAPVRIDEILSGIDELLFGKD